MGVELCQYAEFKPHKTKTKSKSKMSATKTMVCLSIFLLTTRTRQVIFLSPFKLTAFNDYLEATLLASCAGCLQLLQRLAFDQDIQLTVYFMSLSTAIRSTLKT